MSRVPKYNWTWGAADGSRSGVHTLEGRLVWWHRPGGPGAAFGESTREQSFDEFLAHGPPVEVAAAVAGQVEAAVRAGLPPEEGPEDWTRLAEQLDEGGPGGLDPVRATELLRRAAEAGDARAQGLLGKRYYEGTGGLAADPAEARRWFERGAAGGDSRSQNNLGVMDLAAHPADAERWFRQAAAAGNSVAQCNLGNVLWDGRTSGTPDRDEALTWFRRAAEQGYITAQLRLGELLYFAEGCAQDLAGAREWSLRAARQGDPVGQLNAGVLWEKGEGGPASFDDAEMWFRRSAENGNATARRYRNDILRQRLRDVAARATRGTPPDRLPGDPAPPSYWDWSEPIESEPLPDWAWTSGWMAFTVVMPNRATVVISHGEDITQTEGQAGYGWHTRTYTVDEFRAAGPPDEVLERSDWSMLVPILECVVWELGGTEPNWLALLRYHHAVQGASAEVVRYRFADCAAGTARDRLGGRDALDRAVRANRPEMVRFLVTELGHSPNGDRPPLTPLMVAAEHRDDTEMLDALRAVGADPDARNDRGETALLWLLGPAHAAGQWRPKVFDWLLANGADPNAPLLRPTRSGRAPRRGPTALHLLTTSKFLAAVKCELAGKLFAAGATVAAITKRRRAEFRAAVRTWGDGGRHLGRTLATRPNPDNWADNQTLLFRDAVEEVETVVCGVGTGSISNQPYAPDDDFSFSAALHAAGDGLFVRVVKVRTALDDRDETVYWYESRTGGRSWELRATAPPAGLGAAFAELSG
jgi:TPR repeat protein